MTLFQYPLLHRRRIPLLTLLCYCLQLLLLLLVVLFTPELVVEGRRYAHYDNPEMEKLRIKQKPWYMKYISIRGWGSSSSDVPITIPISPISILILLLILFYSIYYFFYSKQTYCIASHILVTDTSKETKEKLIQWKNKIQSNAQLFHQYAHQYSECPSGKNGGSNNQQQYGLLGKFYKYDMAPPFDAVCFDNKTPKHTCIGPIQTQFGYHLIYIHEQQIVK